ncbi:hypothetical protein [Xenorhabdus indica]|uniref:hypothetical protein n=2 Tax=Xenorhabdus indica TaxID=333964 RepID=UPI0021D4E087|nr:hypothetical protein [Xenorhabdus indica]
MLENFDHFGRNPIRRVRSSVIIPDALRLSSAYYRANPLTRQYAELKNACYKKTTYFLTCASFFSSLFIFLTAKTGEEYSEQ